MRIGLYIEVTKGTTPSGIGRHVIGLVNALAKQDHKNDYYLYYQVPVLCLSAKAHSPIKINQKNIHLRPVRFPDNWIGERPSLWWKHYLPQILRFDRLDVFHGPNHFIPLAGNIKKVVTIHDIAYFYMNVHGHGMDRVLQQWTRKSFECADAVVTVSDATKADCIKEGVQEQCITTIYQGFEHSAHYQYSEQEKKQAIKTLGLSKNVPYLLSLGTLQPRKNLSYLVDAFAKIAGDIPHNLILAGAKNESYQSLKALVAQHNLTDRVLFTGYISDVERVVLYENADVFIYPSLYEGFGLVLLEAMSYKLPVITTDISSLPEVVGDAGSIVPLNDINTFAQAILKLTQDTALKAHYIERGQQRCHDFPWQKTAEQTIALYETLTNQK